MMFKNNGHNLSLVHFYYIIIIAILFYQFHYNFGEKLINELEYPEIANLVSWKGNNMSSADTAMLEKELSQTNEDYEEPIANDLLENRSDQVIQSDQHLLNNEVMVNDEVKVNDEQNLKEELSWSTTEITEMLASKAVEGVGPLKFVHEQDIDYDNEANFNEQYERAAITSAEQPANKNKQLSWNNNYYNNKVIHQLGKGFPKSEVNGVEFFNNNKNNFCIVDANQFQQTNDIENNKNPNSCQNSENENLNIENNNNNANWLGNRQSDERKFLPPQGRQSVFSNFARYRTKINPKEISISSLKNKQYLKQFDYALDNQPPRISENNMKLQRYINHNNQAWDDKRYVKGNGIPNFRHRNNFINLRTHMNDNRPSFQTQMNANRPYFQTQDNINIGNRNNSDRMENIELNVNDEAQKAYSRQLDIQKTRNENIVKEALELTHDDKVEEPPTEKSLTDIQKFNSIQKLINFDTSRKQISENQPNINNQPNLTYPNEKFYDNIVNKYPSAPNMPTYNIPNKIDIPNYKFSQVNGIQNNRNNCRFSANSGGKHDEYSKYHWSDFNNIVRNGKMETNTYSNEKYGQRSDEFHEKNVNAGNPQKHNFYQQGNVQNHGLLRQYEQGHPNYFPVNSNDRLKEEIMRSSKKNQWEATEATKEISMVNQSNIYMDKYTLPEKKPRQGRSNIAMINQGRKRFGLNKRLQVPSKVRNKVNYNSPSDMMKILPASERTAVRNTVTVFSVPTPMAMLPAGAVQASQQPYLTTANNATPFPLNTECLITAVTMSNLLLDNKSNNKVHKAVPSYINNSNKWNDEKTELLTTTSSLLKISPTSFKNMLLAEAISVINNPLDNTDSTGNVFDAGAPTETPKQSDQINAINNVPDVSNNDYNPSFLSNASSSGYNQQTGNSRIPQNDGVNSQELQVPDQASSLNSPQDFPKSQSIKNEPSYNVTNNNANISETLPKMGEHENSKAVSESPRNVDQKLSEAKNVNIINSQVSKAKPNNDISANLSRTKSNISEPSENINPNFVFNNDERIQDIIPSSQWTDVNYDDRNRRGIECGCFPANEDDDKTVYSDEGAEESDSNFYSMMNRHNPKALVVRTLNNWIADRENRALLRKENATKNGTKESGIHEKFDDVEQEEEEENENIVGEDLNYYGEGELSPMRFDDPELALVKHHDSQPSRNVQGDGNELGYDEDDQSEGVQLITHAPVKYIKWHNLTNGGFGGLANQRHPG